MMKFSVKSEGCCSVQPARKAECPQCHKRANGVLEKTLLHLLTSSTLERLACLEGFFYCQTPSCEVVYFQEKQRLTQEDMRVVVGLKEGATPAMVCYCFDWSVEKIHAQIEATGKTDVLEDIKQKMKELGCACEVKNPSGRCCLGDVSKVLKKFGYNSA